MMIVDGSSLEILTPPLFNGGSGLHVETPTPPLLVVIFDVALRDKHSSDFRVCFNNRFRFA